MHCLGILNIARFYAKPIEVNFFTDFSSLSELTPTNISKSSFDIDPGTEEEPMCSIRGPGIRW